MVWALDAGGVAVAGDVPSGLPTPDLPPLDAFSLDLLTGEPLRSCRSSSSTAGVAESAPTKDASPDADSRAQGYANVASGLVVELVRRDDGRFEERHLPPQLPGDAVKVVNVHRSGRLYSPASTTMPVKRGSSLHPLGTMTLVRHSRSVGASALVLKGAAR